MREVQDQYSDNLRKIYNKSVEALGLTDSYDQFLGYFNESDENRRKVYDKAVSSFGLTDSYEDFLNYAGYAPRRMTVQDVENQNKDNSITFDKKTTSFDDWYPTVPADRNDTKNYNLRRAFELAPAEELEAWRTATPEELEKGEKHLRSVYENENGEYEFMKSKNHPTLKMELDWYNSDDAEAVEFKRKYRIETEGGKYYKYVRRDIDFDDMSVANAAKNVQLLESVSKEIGSIQSKYSWHPVYGNMLNDLKNDVKYNDLLYQQELLTDYVNRLKGSDEYRKGVQEVHSFNDRFRDENNLVRGDAMGKLRKHNFNLFGAGGRMFVTEKALHLAGVNMNAVGPGQEDMYNDAAADFAIYGAEQKVRLAEDEIANGTGGFGTQFARGWRNSNWNKLDKQMTLNMALQAYKIAKKFDENGELLEGKTLSESETRLFKALQIAYLADNTVVETMWERIGENTPEQVKYTLEFILTSELMGASALSKGIAGAATRNIENKVAKKLVYKVADYTAQPLLQTLYNPLNWMEGSIERQTGNLTYDENTGNFAFAGAQNEWDATRNAIVSAWIENFSEKIGEDIFKPIVKPLKYGNKKLRNMDNAFGSVYNKFATKIDVAIENAGLHKIDDVLKISKDIRLSTGVQGIPGEYVEEVVGGIMNAMFVGDQSFHQYDENGNPNPNYLWNSEQQLETFLSCAVMSIGMTTVSNIRNGAVGAAERRKAKSYLDAATKAMRNQGLDVDAIDKAFEKGTLKDASQELFVTGAAENMTDDKRQILSNYIAAKINYKAMRHADMGALEEQFKVIEDEARASVNAETKDSDGSGGRIIQANVEVNGETFKGVPIVSGRVLTRIETDANGNDYMVLARGSSSVLYIRVPGEEKARPIYSSQVKGIVAATNVDEYIEKQKNMLTGMMIDMFGAQYDGGLPLEQLIMECAVLSDKEMQIGKTSVSLEKGRKYHVFDDRSGKIVESAFVEDTQMDGEQYHVFNINGENIGMTDSELKESMLRYRLQLAEESGTQDEAAQIELDALLRERDADMATRPVSEDQMIETVVSSEAAMDESGNFTADSNPKAVAVAVLKSCGYDLEKAIASLQKSIDGLAAQTAQNVVSQQSGETASPSLEENVANANAVSDGTIANAGIIGMYQQAIEEAKLYMPEVGETYALANDNGTVYGRFEGYDADGNVQYRETDESGENDGRLVVLPKNEFLKQRMAYAERLFNEENNEKIIENGTGQQQGTETEQKGTGKEIENENGGGNAPGNETTTGGLNFLTAEDHDKEMEVYGNRSILTDYKDGVAIYTDENGEPAILLAAVGDDSYVGLFRVEGNRWSSKMENATGDKNVFRGLISAVMNQLPEGAELIERSSVSADGIRVIANQLKHGFAKTGEFYECGINGADVANVLGEKYKDDGSFKDIYANQESLTVIRQALKPFMESLGLTENDIFIKGNHEKGKVIVRLPVIAKVKEDVQSDNGTTPVAEENSREPIPVGRGSFGNIYNNFRGKAKEAVEFLIKKKSGEATGALSHRSVGEIDIVWGDEGTGKSDGFGLAKLVKYHPEVVWKLQELLDEMEVVSRTANRVNLESKTHKAGVRLDWDGERKTWLMTMFEKKGASEPADGTTDITGNQSGSGNDTAPSQNPDVSSGKDNTKTNTEEGNSEKKSIPLDRDGNIDHSALDPEDAETYAAAVNAEADNAADFAAMGDADYVRRNMEAAAKAVERAGKMKPKSTGAAQLKKELADINAKKAAAKRLAEFWDAVANEVGRRASAQAAEPARNDTPAAPISQQGNEQIEPTDGAAENEKKHEPSEKVKKILKRIDEKTDSIDYKSDMSSEVQRTTDEKIDVVESTWSDDNLQGDVLVNGEDVNVGIVCLLSDDIKDKPIYTLYWMPKQLIDGNDFKEGYWQTVDDLAEKYNKEHGTNIQMWGDSGMLFENKDNDTRSQDLIDFARWANEQIKAEAESETIHPAAKEERLLTDDEAKAARDKLASTQPIPVDTGVIKAANGKSARAMADKWADENLSEPIQFDTEAGAVILDKRSIADSLAHGYSQAKLDAITSLRDGFAGATYLGSSKDTSRPNTTDHYFAYPIMYNGELSYVFCRAKEDINKNRLYVHEVFVADKIKNNTLQTAAELNSSKPHGGVAFYRNILSWIVSGGKDTQISDTEDKKKTEKVDISNKAGSGNKLVTDEQYEELGAKDRVDVKRQKAEGVSEPTETYTTTDGKSVQYTLFDLNNENDGISGNRGRGADGRTRPNSLQRKDGRANATDPRKVRLRKLEPGEFCMVERVYTKSKQFSFTSGKNKVESYEDVAYIFKQLETASIENVFVVLIKDGHPTVVHIGMGSYSSSMVDLTHIVPLFNEMNPDAVFFVHNHPSGYLYPSNNDRNLLNKLRGLFGNTVQDGVIIDTFSGKFATFNDYDSSVHDEKSADATEKKVDVYTFDTQKFLDKSERKKIRNPQDMAEFISTQRLGNREKMSALILDNQLRIVGNVHLPYNKVEGNESNVARELLDLVTRMGGSGTILYGNNLDGNYCSRVANFMNQYNMKLFDALKIDSDVEGSPYGSYKSFSDMGVLEPGSKYDASQQKAEDVDAEKIDLSEDDADDAQMQVSDEEITSDDAAAEAVINQLKSIGITVHEISEEEADESLDDADVQHHVVKSDEEKSELEEALKDGTERRYCAMQVIDGKLYPVMSAYDDNGEIREASEIGRWEKSDEDPDAADANGNYRLRKTDRGKGKPGMGDTPARYNPYFHVSDSPLNDQFSGASTRPNVVIVEVEVPVSEKTSGYRAEKAKDSVGELQWHSGPVNSQLTNQRTVMLSRWRKPVRIVPYSEVADMIVRQMGDDRPQIPFNTLHPELRDELEKRGVEINDNWDSRTGKGNPFKDGKDTTTRLKEEAKSYINNVGYNPRNLIPKVRGGWTEKKILKYLKEYNSLYGNNTGARLIAEFDNIDELRDHMYWHGSPRPQSKLAPSIVKSEKWAERYGGGGYGSRYWAISITKNKKTATNFSGIGRDVVVHPIILAKNAVVKDMTDTIGDSAELEDYIVQLYEEGVDAVWIGGGEQELCVINPRAIVNIDSSQSFDTFGMWKRYTNGELDNPTDEQLESILSIARHYAENPVREKGKPSKPSRFVSIEGEGTMEFKPKEQYDKEIEEYNRKLDEYYKSDEYREYVRQKNELREGIKFHRTSDGIVYGFAKGGEIYLNRERLNPDTPIHEYTHLWDEACRQANPELWRRGVELMKQTSEWARVMADENYRDIRDDEDKVASEVHSRLAGREGAMVLGQMQREAEEAGTAIDMVEKMSLLDRVKTWVNDFWKWVKDTLTPWTREEAAKVSVEDFVNMPMGDLFRGVNPNEYRDRTIEQLDMEYMEAVRRGDMETAQRMVNEAARRAMPDTKVVDGNGNPLVVYHGSHEHFTKFSHEKSGGLFNFAKEKHNAQRYAFGNGGARTRYTNVLISNHSDIAWGQKGDNYEIIGTVIRNSEGEYIGVDRNAMPTNFKGYRGYKYKKTYTIREIGELEERDYDEYVDQFSYIPENANTKAFFLNVKGLLDISEGWHYNIKHTAKQKLAIGVFEDIYKEAKETQQDGKVFFILNEILYGGREHEFDNFWNATQYEAFDRAFEKFIAGALKRRGFDGIYYIDDSHKTYVVFDSNQIKSAEPVTYDDNGEVIPLSKRFDIGEDDTRYQIIQTQSEVDDIVSNAGREPQQREDGAITDGQVNKLNEDIEQSKQIAFDAVRDALAKAGIEVVEATDEEVRELRENNSNLRSSNGTLRGWVDNENRIHLSKDGMNAETAVHEYTHIWVEGMRTNNLELWEQVKDLLIKDNPMYDEIKKSSAYANIKNNNDKIAEEILARISGKQNAKRIEDAARKLMDENPGTEGAIKAASLIERLRDALNRFWTWCGKTLFGKKGNITVDQVTEMVLADLVNNVNPDNPNGRGNKAAKSVNNNFNEQLERLTPENADSVVLSLGYPSAILTSAGIADKPLKLYGNKLVAKAKKHGFLYNELKDLPNAVAKPMMIFHGSEPDSYAIFTEMRIGDKNVLVSVSVGKDNDVDFNLVSSVYGKNSQGVVYWINNNKTIYANKEKALDYLRTSAPIADARLNQEFISAAKIIQNFVNPTENFERLSFEDEVSADTEEMNTAIVSDILNKKLGIRNDGSRKKNIHGYLIEKKRKWMDSLDPLKKLQQSIAEATGKPLADFEDAYNAELRRAAISPPMIERYTYQYLIPMIESVGDILKYAKDKGLDIDEKTLGLYLIAKHGLERNEYFKKLNDWKEVRDMSGLTALAAELGRADEDFTEVAKDFVKEIEDSLPKEMVDKMWGRIKDTTNAILDKYLESGMISKKQRDEYKQRYKYYVPLRGWDETTSDEFYNYSVLDPHFQSAIKQAKGRTSLANNVLANIMNMTESAIVIGEKNKVLQRLFNLALGRKNDVLKTQRSWYVKNQQGEWEETLPIITEDMTPEQVKRAVEEFEEKMSLLSAKGEAKQTLNRADVGVKIKPFNVHEHYVPVFINGRKHAIIINGNPNIVKSLTEVNDLKSDKYPAINIALDVIRKSTRFMSQLNTTFNPEFIVKNVLRDAGMAMISSYIEGGMKYANKVRSNINKFGYRYLGQLIRNGECDNTTITQYWKEFIDNGGETGFTRTLNVDEQAKRLKKMYKNMLSGKDVDRKSVFETLTSAIDSFNRWGEDLSRFAVFVTNRQMGKTVEQSVNMAKNATVNFQRKGGGFLAAWFRTTRSFFNAGMQALYRFGSLAKNNPKRFAIASTAMVVSGLIVPALNILMLSLFGDKDDWDAYIFMSEFTGNHSWHLFVGNGFATLPYPQDLATFFAAGNIIFRHAIGWADKDSTIAGDIFNMALEHLPFDMGGDGSIAWKIVNTLVPQALQPSAEVFINEDFMGRPIYEKNPYNENDPNWTKAFKSTSGTLVELAKRLNGNDPVMKHSKFWDTFNNPAAWQHILEGEAGGIGRIVKNLSRMLEHGFSADNMPFLRNLYMTSDMSKYAPQVSRDYYNLLNGFDEMNDYINGYEKDGETMYENLDRYTKLKTSPEYKAYLATEDLIKTIKEKQDNLKLMQAYDAKDEDIETMRNTITSLQIMVLDITNNLIIEEGRPLTKKFRQVIDDIRNGEEE